MKKYTDNSQLVTALLSLCLAVEFNQKKPNAAIKATCKKLMERLDDEYVIDFCKWMQSLSYPVGQLNAYDVEWQNAKTKGN